MITESDLYANSLSLLLHLKIPLLFIAEIRDGSFSFVGVQESPQPTKHQIISVIYEIKTLLIERTDVAF